MSAPLTSSTVLSCPLSRLITSSGISTTIPCQWPMTGAGMWAPMLVTMCPGQWCPWSAWTWDTVGCMNADQATPNQTQCLSSFLTVSRNRSGELHKGSWPSYQLSEIWLWQGSIVTGRSMLSLLRTWPKEWNFKFRKVSRWKLQMVSIELEYGLLK